MCMDVVGGHMIRGTMGVHRCGCLTCSVSSVAGLTTYLAASLISNAMLATASAWFTDVSSNPAATMYASPIVSTCMGER